MDKKVVESLLEKAAKAGDAAQAINFAQAACNAANAIRVMADIADHNFGPSKK